MSWLQVVVLSVVQGLTEFLPISSSGHLAIVSRVFFGEDAGASFTSVHFPRDEVTWTVMANTMGAAWPVHRAVAEHVDQPPSHI